MLKELESIQKDHAVISSNLSLPVIQSLLKTNSELISRVYGNCMFVSMKFAEGKLEKRMYRDALSENVRCLMYINNNYTLISFILQQQAAFSAYYSMSESRPTSVGANRNNSWQSPRNNSNPGAGAANTSTVDGPRFHQRK